jgi:uncharacterized protein (TIGR02217 family)
MADETILDDKLALGFTEVSLWNTTVVTLSGGNETRNARWQAPLRRYEFAYNPRPLADVQAVVAFFHDARGMARTWLLKSWTDYRLVNGVIGTGDGAETDFQIVKSYGTLQPYSRDILYLKPGTLSVTVDEVPATVSSETYGLVVLSSAPSNGAIVRATCEFYVPARFSTDELRVRGDLPDAELASIEGLTAVEVRE